MEIFKLLFPVFSIIALGYVFKRFRLIGPEAVHSLNMFVYYVALPAVIFNNFWRINWHEKTALSTIGFNVAILVFFALLLLVVLQLGKFSAEYKAAIFMCALVGNTVYIGFPLAASAFGQGSFPQFVAAAVPHLVLGIVFSILAVEFFVVRTRRISTYIHDLFFNPLILGMLFGIAASLVQFQGAFATLLAGPVGMLGATASPVALFALGAFLDGKFSNAHGSVYPMTVALKLIALPLVILLAGVLFGGAANALRSVSLLAGAMPTAATAFVISEKYDILPNFVAHVMLISTVCSFVTIGAVLIFVS